ncbi:SDR family oxidoreductase [Streptomyces sp. NPDC096311]|uniref:SDR family oxidoreductase n=1 Tax=Streptomyces sp. NPDC096311 TaxID=3366083 RepID=UPI003807BC94
MSRNFDLGYSGTRVIVSGGGGAGMGASLVGKLTELGAEVHVLDLKEPPTGTGAVFHKTNLSDPAAITATVAEIGGPVNALFNCVGVPGTRTTPLETMLINFAGVRHLTESVIPFMDGGGSVTTVASQAGAGWAQNLDTWLPLVQTEGFEGAREWLEKNIGDVTVPYNNSKEVLVIWTQYSAVALGEKNIRTNVIGPGPTATPMTEDFEKLAGKDFWDKYPIPLHRPATPDEQADTLVFLGSAAASCVTGSYLITDGGTNAGLVTGLLKITR